MGADSKIEWTHHTFNPWWGCSRVSPGCENCYAETFDRRLGGKHWGANAERRFFGAAHWREPLKWDKAAAKAGERHRVFCASMADVFEDREDLDEPRNSLWDLILSTPHLDWLLLTKRPENLERLLPWPGMYASPFRNVWLGTTVEDQKRADERIPHLLRVPAAVRFLSCEPLLEKVNLGLFMHCDRCGELADDGTAMCPSCGEYPRRIPMIDWVIVGGESGHVARPFHLEWARSLVRQCRAADVAVHVKQVGAAPHEHAVGQAGLYAGTPLRIRLCDRKGGDWNEWPEDLRIREYPKEPQG